LRQRRRSGAARPLSVGTLKGAAVLATLQRLGVVASFSRRRISDEIPYSEALFGTLKCRPISEPTFRDIDEALDG
jgi:hypothetical protein